MGSERPVLVHVAGPQKGLRVVLKYPLAVAGRSSTAQIVLKEEFISRQHLKFEITPDGCVVENLSSAGTLINGKKYKTGKKIILGTGDVLAVGQQTKILFVEAGSDVKEALDAYWQKNPGDQPLPAPDLPAEALAPVDPNAPAAAVQAATPILVPEEPPLEPILVSPEEAPPTENISSEEQELVAQSTARKAKVRKYALMGGVYMVIIAGVIMLLQSIQHKDKTTGPPGMPAKLEPKKIEEILIARPKRQPNAYEAQSALQRARSRYENRRILPGDLYRCFKEFKLFLAYSVTPVFVNAEDERKYTAARDELKKDVIDRYEQAYIQERNRDWKKAHQFLEDLLKIIPERDDKDPVHELVQNILDHEKYINPYIAKK